MAENTKSLEDIKQEYGEDSVEYSIAVMMAESNQSIEEADRDLNGENLKEGTLTRLSKRIIGIFSSKSEENTEINAPEEDATEEEAEEKAQNKFITLFDNFRRDFDAAQLSKLTQKEKSKAMEAAVELKELAEEVKSLSAQRLKNKKEKAEKIKKVVEDAQKAIEKAETEKEVADVQIVSLKKVAENKNGGRAVKRAQSALKKAERESKAKADVITAKKNMVALRVQELSKAIDIVNLARTDFEDKRQQFENAEQIVQDLKDVEVRMKNVKEAKVEQEMNDEILDAAKESAKKEEAEEYLEGDGAALPIDTDISDEELEGKEEKAPLPEQEEAPTTRILTPKEVAAQLDQYEAEENGQIIEELEIEKDVVETPADGEKPKDAADEEETPAPVDGLAQEEEPATDKPAEPEPDIKVPDFGGDQYMQSLAKFAEDVGFKLTTVGTTNDSDGYRDCTAVKEDVTVKFKAKQVDDKESFRISIKENDEKAQEAFIDMIVAKAKAGGDGQVINISKVKNPQMRAAIKSKAEANGVKVKENNATNKPKPNSPSM